MSARLGLWRYDIAFLIGIAFAFSLAVLFGGPFATALLQ